MTKAILTNGLILMSIMNINLLNDFNFFKTQKHVQTYVYSSYEMRVDTSSYDYLISQVKKKIGTEVPDWTLNDLNDKRYNSSDMKGKVVLIEFWSTNCGACVKVAKDVSKIDSAYSSKGLVVVQIECDKVFSKEKIKSYTEQRGIFKNTLINGYAISRMFNQKAYPTFFLIDRKGIIVFTHIGWFYGNTKNDLVEQIEKIIN